MAFDIGKIISDFYSAASSPSAQLARRGMAAEKEAALNNEDYRKRRLQEMIDKAAADRQGLVNEGANSRQLLENSGQLANTEAKNTGAMARQKLMEDTKRAEDLNTFNRGIFNTQADIFKTQVLGNAKQPDNTLRGKEMEVAASILNNINTDPNSPQAKWAMGILNSGQRNSGTQQTARPAAQPARKQFSPPSSFDNNKDTILPPAVSLYREETPDFARQMLQNAQDVPSVPAKSLAEQDAEFDKTSRSSTGFSFFNSPSEAAAMRKKQDMINARPIETEDERKKRQAANRARIHIS